MMVHVYLSLHLYIYVSTVCQSIESYTICLVFVIFTGFVCLSLYVLFCNIMQNENLQLENQNKSRQLRMAPMCTFMIRI